MRRFLLKLSVKIRYRWFGVYTWLLKGELKSCGKRVRFEYPVRLEQRHLITVGDGVIIYPRTWINPVSEWAGCRYDGQVILHNNVKIGYGVQISAAKLVEIEEEAALSTGCVIVDHLHDHMHLDMPIFLAPISDPLPVRIGRRAFLGVNCFIAPGVQIGEHAVVAANAYVTRDVPAYCAAIGNPARISRFYTPSDSSSTSDAASEANIG